MTKTRDLANLGGGFIQAGGDAKQRTVESKLQDAVSVLDFIPQNEHAAIKDGTSTYDAGSDIQAAITASTNLVFPPGTYVVNTSVSITSDTIISAHGATITRTADSGPKIFVVTGGLKFEVYGGTFDGKNKPTNRGMLIDINASASDVVLQDVVFKNNCPFESTDVPIKSQDTDHVNVQRAASLRVNNCTFTLASRQGISVTAALPYTQITNCLFEDCYLFGIDFEANTASAGMWDRIVIHDNTFKNNGVKDYASGNYVWNGANGPLQVIYTSDLSLRAANYISFKNNIITSTDCAAPAVTQIEPLIAIEQFSTCDFTNNTVDNLGLIRIGTSQTLTSDSINFVGNCITNNGGSQENYVYIGQASTAVVAGNKLRQVDIQNSPAVVTGNIVETSIKFSSGAGNATVTGNTFLGTADIDAASATSEIVASGNEFSGADFRGSGTFKGSYATGPLVVKGADGPIQRLISPTFQSTTGSTPLFDSGVIYLPTSSTGNTITIPITSQVSRWLRHVLHIRWHSAEDNTNSTDYGFARVAFTSKNSISSIVVPANETGGTYSSIGTSGMNLTITLSTNMNAAAAGRNGISIYYEILSERPWYVEMNNATFN